jgi:hypothetical protein
MAGAVIFIFMFKKCVVLYGVKNSNKFFFSVKHNSIVLFNLLALPTDWMVRGSNPGGCEIFRTCPDRPWGPPSLLYNGYWVFPGDKEQPGRDTDPSPPSSAAVKNRVELYLYSP